MPGSTENVTGAIWPLRGNPEEKKFFFAVSNFQADLTVQYNLDYPTPLATGVWIHVWIIEIVRITKINTVRTI